MTVLLRLSDDATLFEVRYIGEIDHRVRVRAVHEMESRLKDCWVKQLLLDFTQAVPVGDVDDVHVDAVRKAWDRATFPRGVRVALLNAPEHYDRPMVMAGRSRHFVTRRFHDRRHALAWLRGRL